MKNKIIKILDDWKVNEHKQELIADELLILCVVSQQRELLLAYEQSKCPKTWWMSKSQAECEVDDFLANNCG